MTTAKALAANSPIPVSSDRTSRRARDIRWLIVWGLFIVTLFIWDAFFLNRPALHRVITGAINTAFISLAAVISTFLVSWGVVQILHTFEHSRQRFLYIGVVFFLNLLRSIPQIIGVLFGYITITYSMETGILVNKSLILVMMALCISLFMVNEMVDLMRERIAFFRRSDFYDAMRVCGISEMRIINRDILWKNSRLHIFNKLISVFGMAVFLQCSVDFVISVGLSTQVNTVNLPTTLGGVLAHIESKQDILAIGHTLTHPFYFGNLFFQHLQGVTTALLIVVSLLCIHNIANGFAERHRL